MSTQNTKDLIVGYINTISNLDFSKLYVDGPSVVEWDQMNSEEVKKFVDGVVLVLSNLKNNISVLDSVAISNINDIKNNLEQIITTYNNNVVNLEPKQITSHHHNTLNNFSSLVRNLRSVGLYTELKLLPNFNETVEKLKEANKQLKDFKSQNFETAISLVDSLIEKKVSFEDKTIKEHLGTFLHRADEHKINKFSGKWWWLLAAVIMGGVIIYIVNSFISVIENYPLISVGEALLRISSLIIPSYFMIFFLNQFSYHKRMYEIYSFKNTALNTMVDLMKTNSSKSDYILEKGLDVLFAEPQVKDDGKYDKQLVSELIGIVKNQITK